MEYAKLVQSLSDYVMAAIDMFLIIPMRQETWII